MTRPMNCRAIVRPLCTAPAALSASKMGASTQKPETPVMALFRQWRILMDYINTDDEMTDEKMGPLYELQRSLTVTMMREPSTDAQDHLAKIIASTTWGEHDLEDDGTAEFWAEARALMGVRAPDEISAT